MNVRNMFSRIFNNGPFDKGGFYAFISEEKKFIPTEKLKNGQWPTIFMRYELFDIGGYGKDSNEKTYNIILLNNGVPIDSTKKEGQIYKSSAYGDNKYFEKHVQELADESERISLVKNGVL